MRKLSRKKGFTLLELIIVIIILGILASLGIPRYFDAIQRARDAEAKGTLGEIYKIEQAYYSVNSAYMPAGLIGNGLTIGADLDGDGSNEISMVIPASTNFAYGKSGTFLQATSSTGHTNWQINLNTGGITTF